ncbi:3634_t:CDS:1 [Gigaspora margarita]|uniref:3634_t:CDS:1 n=1 Tax=Gigaspora margarita TaxID=4874 RepID=A0ABN7U9Y3_GIGMA|nr:3634_t:CDS:1 [Gigaspora margarita]
MPQRDFLNVPSATWQWLGPLKSLFLIIIIALWGYFLEKCGEQTNDTQELQQLMGLGSFIVTIAFSILIESTFSHIFAYIQGFFLCSKQGIPLRAIIIGGNPLRVSIECFYLLKQKSINRYQLISYLSILAIYILSFGIGTYAVSNLGTPYIVNTTSFNWIQAPTTITEELNSSMLNIFASENSLLPYSFVQFNSLSSWVEKTKTDITEIAFMPFTIAQKQGQNLTKNDPVTN